MQFLKTLIGIEKAIISDGMSSLATITEERRNYNAMIEIVTIKK